MTKQDAIKIFGEKKVRTVWDSDREEWYFSIVDVIAILTEQPTHQGARNRSLFIKQPKLVDIYWEIYTFTTWI